ncbi:ChiQ/YbfN family lipoprotein [Enterobacteriaceae bacterium LUAb1]
MKKNMLLIFMCTTLVGCTSPYAPTEASLVTAYHNCIRNAEGSLEKITACKIVLDVMHKQEQHRAFAEAETVHILDYQRCLTAQQTGGGQAIRQQCDNLWREIRHNHKQGRNNENIQGKAFSTDVNDISGMQSKYTSKRSADR